MDPQYVVRGEDGILRCTQCGFVYDLDPLQTAEQAFSGYERFQFAVLAVPEARQAVHPSPGVWSVNEYAAHMEDVANLVYERVRNIAEQDGATLEWFDPDEVVERGRYNQRPAVESLEPLQVSVAAFKRYVEVLDPGVWNQVGNLENAGEVRLSEIAQDLAHELTHHTQDVERAIAP